MKWPAVCSHQTPLGSTGFIWVVCMSHLYWQVSHHDNGNLLLIGTPVHWLSGYRLIVAQQIWVGGFCSQCATFYRKAKGMSTWKVEVVLCNMFGVAIFYCRKAENKPSLLWFSSCLQNCFWNATQTCTNLMLGLEVEAIHPFSAPLK